MSTPLAPIEEASTASLMREVLDEAKELIRLDLEIAKNEATLELDRAKRAIIGLAIGLAASSLVLCLLAVASIMAIGGTASSALAIAGVVLVIGAVATWIGYGSIPMSPLRRTRGIVRDDVHQLKEHIG